MRLFEYIIEANKRALAGDATAGIHVADFLDELPVIALTCIDPRLNRLFPGVLALPDEQFIWLRNAGNIVTQPINSTIRSIALACVLKGGKEIALIGHTDCKVGQTKIGEIVDRFRKLGIERDKLPENLTEFLGVFSSERQNVIRGVEYIRQSPLIGPKIPVQGLLVNTDTGELEWLVNGYDAIDRGSVTVPFVGLPTLGANDGNLKPNGGLAIGEMKFPESKIGEAPGDKIATTPPARPEPPPRPTVAPAAPPLPPPPLRARPVPVPPPIRLRTGGKDGR